MSGICDFNSIFTQDNTPAALSRQPQIALGHGWVSSATLATFNGSLALKSCCLSAKLPEGIP